MTDREKQIINLIKENPLITQEEISDELNCARTSVAVHISNLMKKGVILGKKYIINEEPYILTIGGANIDIQGKASSSIIKYDSNPGNINISYGGVGKNIAENIAKLGISSKFITALGNDIYGQDFINYLKGRNIDILDTLLLDNEKTSMYMSILNDENEMEIAISSMDICKSITPQYLDNIRKKIINSSLIVVDTNLEEETLRYIVDLRKKPNIILDTISTKKAMKVKNFIGKFHTIKLNKLEAEALSGINISTDDNLKKVGEYFINKGVKRVYISLGLKGVLYMSDKTNDFDIINPSKINVVNANGTSEAFMSMLAYGEYNGFDTKTCARYGIAAAMITAMDTKTISDKFNIKNIKNMMLEMEI